MDKWICNKCGFVTFEKPVKRVATCANVIAADIVL